MRINLTVDSSHLKTLNALRGPKLAYGVAAAINQTAKEIQADERASIDKKFTVRNPEFMRRQAAVIKPFANARQGRPYAEIGVGQKPRLLLASFEQGADRGPFTPGAKQTAIPVIGSPARPTFASSVPAALQFKALRFTRTRPLPGLGFTKSGRARRTKKKARGILYGQQGTYLLPGVGVFQRKTGERSRRLLYSFKTKVRLKPQLKFVKTAEDRAQASFHSNMERQVADALAHSRSR